MDKGRVCAVHVVVQRCEHRWYGLTEMEVEEKASESSEGELEQNEANGRPNVEQCDNGEVGEEMDSENQSQSEERTEKKDVEMEEEEKEKSDSTEQPLFRLTVVNSYGSQELQKLVPGTTYKLSCKKIHIIGVVVVELQCLCEQL